MSEYEREQLRQIRGGVDWLEKSVAELWNEVSELRRELAAFQGRFDALGRPVRPVLDPSKRIAEDAERMRGNQ